MMMECMSNCFEKVEKSSHHCVPTECGLGDPALLPDSVFPVPGSGEINIRLSAEVLIKYSVQISHWYVL